MYELAHRTEKTANNKEKRHWLTNKTYPEKSNMQYQFEGLFYPFYG